MKKYRISVFEEMGGYATIEAENRFEAIRIANEILNTDGVGAFADFDLTHRAVDVLEGDITELK